MLVFMGIQVHGRLRVRLEGGAGRQLEAVARQGGIELARGLANYGSSEARLIARRPSSDIEELLGYAAEPELIHRDNMVLA